MARTAFILALLVGLGLILVGQAEASQGWSAMGDKVYEFIAENGRRRFIGGLLDIGVGVGSLIGAASINKQPQTSIQLFIWGAIASFVGFILINGKPFKSVWSEVILILCAGFLYVETNNNTKTP